MELPPVWRALDRAVQHWVRVHSGSPELAAVAGWASYADGAGDAALPLLGDGAGRHGMPPLAGAEVEALRREPLVGDGRAVTPFVIDADGRFALWRNYADECAIAAAIAQRRAAAMLPSPEALTADLTTLFAQAPATAQRQRDAVAAAVGRRLFVLTGGPGTGKTTTVLRLLLMRLRASPSPLRIRLAAPTGKAAQRLLQALRAGKAALRSGTDALPDAWQPLLAQIPEDAASTLHRLLGYDPQRNRFTRHRARPLAADIVVVDEASMLDLAALRGLLDAVPDTAALILLGDADQLTSVAAGSVLMDLVAALEREGAPELVRLEHSFRAQRELARLNDSVRQGEPAAFAAALNAAAPAVRVRAVADTASLRAFARDWATELAALPIRPVLPSTKAPQAQQRPVQASLFDPPASSPAVLARQALRALAQRQLLCALREDAFGALALNVLIETELKALWNVAPELTWYPGRAVLIARNDYGLQLFNGDVGLCLADADGRLRVWFETEPDARALPPDSLPAHEGAFAITVHKSQGSEYAHAALLLPPDPAHRILSRQLLYTGISRAKQRLDLCASADVANAALARPVLRAGGLAAKLRQARRR
ncbi:MAG: exodeoxyribonuclease V subunit alpha [Rhodanobacteraceae bacterium]|nr:exodeoxyribonuclease V subunit alpha [Rhodanobacteraceae bacterium]